MTTVIIDTVNRVIYTDSQGTVEHTTRNIRKIFPSDASNYKSAIITGSGKLKDVEKVYRFVENDGDPNDEAAVRKLDISPDSEVYIVTTTREHVDTFFKISRKKRKWYQILKPATTVIRVGELSSEYFFGYYLSGSGTKYAGPVLVATQNPILAIETASKIDLYTNDVIQSQTF